MHLLHFSRFDRAWLLRQRTLRVQTAWDTPTSSVFRIVLNRSHISSCHGMRLVKRNDEDDDGYRFASREVTRAIIVTSRKSCSRNLNSNTTPRSPVSYPSIEDNCRQILDSQKYIKIYHNISSTNVQHAVNTNKPT